jgi:hypothetical protein
MSDDTMSAFECYKEYIALKNHFTKPSYSYHKYNGKTKLSFQSFESRKDKIYFMKVAKHPDPVNYILSNLLENDKLWIKDIAYSDSAKLVYQDWQKRQQSLMYMFSQELSKLANDFDSNFISEDNSHPYVIKLFLRKEISLETLVMLVDLVKCVKTWKNKYEYDPIVDELLTKIVKYRPFLQYDHDKVKKIVIDNFSNR